MIAIDDCLATTADFNTVQEEYDTSNFELMCFLFEFLIQTLN